MKKLISTIALFGIVVLAASPAPGAAAADISGNLTLSGAWALYPMALKWVEEFQKINPGVKIDVQAGGAGKGIADALAGMVDIGMVSRNVQPAELEKGAFPVAVTKDAVIPTLSVRNPLLKDLLARGLKKDEFAGVWITKTVTS